MAFSRKYNARLRHKTESELMELLHASLVAHRALAEVQWPEQPSERDKPAGSVTPEPQAHSLSYTKLGTLVFHFLLLLYTSRGAASPCSTAHLQCPHL